MAADPVPVAPAELDGGDESPDTPFGKPAEEYYKEKNVIHATEYIKNARNLSIFTQSWVPAEGAPRGLLFLCHGYGNDSSWLFQVVAVEFASHGLAVFALDYEGHGRSDGLRAGVRDFGCLVDDAHAFFASVRERPQFEGLPRFFYGESLGGAVVICIARKDPTGWDGAILASPMCKISDKMRPPWPVEKLLELATWLSPDAAIVPSKEILSVSFRDPAQRTKAFANPRRYKGRPRLAFASQLLKATRDIAAHMEDFRLPFLIIHGELDPVTDPVVSKELYERSESTDKELKLYPAAWHQLLAGEPPEEAAAIWKDVFTWLDPRLEGARASS